MYKDRRPFDKHLTEILKSIYLTGYWLLIMNAYATRNLRLCRSFIAVGCFHVSLREL